MVKQYTKLDAFLSFRKTLVFRGVFGWKTLKNDSLQIKDLYRFFTKLISEYCETFFVCSQSSQDRTECNYLIK